MYQSMAAAFRVFAPGELPDEPTTNVPAVAKVLQNWAYVFSVLGSLDMTRGEEGEPVPQMIRLPHPEAEAAAAEEEAAAAAAAAAQGRQ